MSYVVLVKPPDDHPGAARIFGPWQTSAKAAEFCKAVRQRTDAYEDALTDMERVGQESFGYAYMLQVEAPRKREAYRWAIEGVR